MESNFYKLVFVTQKQSQDLDSYLNLVETCAKSGITSVQLREKSLSIKELITLGQALQSILKPLRIPLIVNDHLEVAHKLNADGLHLGQSDGDLLQARKLLGPHKLLGLSVNSHKELLAANKLPIDYVGIGAIYPTKNKQDIQSVWGCKNLKQLTTSSVHKVIAIGGINLNNISQVMSTGVHGIAAIGIFHQSKNPSYITKQMRNSIEQEKT